MPKRVLEEVAGHRGIRAVFGDQYDSMLDGVYRDFFETEEFREVVQRYFRGRELESVDDQRYATEEFLAHNARMRPELKPAWWKSFLERVKMALRKLPGFHNLRFTDRELERILIRGIGAVRKGKSEGNAEGGEMRFSIDGETKIFSLSELLQRFKDELSGTELNAEQQGIYDVVTGESKKTVIRKEDLETLEEFVLLKGGRGKGAKKIIQVHYAGVRGPVTALEIVNIGDVIRRGTYIPGDEAHPTSRTYELTTDDRARLRVVVDYDKQKNKSVINFYSNRKNENRAHEASSGSITDSRITIAPESGNVKHSLEDGSDFSDGTDKYTLENAKASKEGYRVERVNENAGREFNEADGVVCKKDVVFTSSELPKTGKMKWIKERLVAYSREHGVLGLHETSCLDDFVKVTENGIVNDLNHRGTAIRQNMIAVIPEMLKNAVLIQTESDRRSKTHILAVKVRYGDERFVVGLVVNENNGKYFYDHELTEINAVADGTSEKTDAGQTKASVLNVIRKALLSSGFDTGSEKNLRFSIEQYSDADWSDMVTYLKAKVGNLLTKPDGEYKKILEDAGMECYSEADAHACAVEAMNANLKDAQARRKEEMMNWIVENNTWIQRIAEVTGSPEFKIRPSYRFQGMDFTGAYISQAWRDCSGNPKAKNREKRLKEASGYHSDELAQMIADKYGGDAIEIENDLIEYFQHKKKKASKTERENGELGVYDEYYAFKKEERLFNRELDRQMQEQWEAQEAVRVGDEIKSILEEKRVIGAFPDGYSAMMLAGARLRHISTTKWEIAGI